jgi:hypothetical protein
VIQLDAPLIVLEDRTVEPETTVRERRLDAELRGLDFLFTKLRDLNGEERPRIDAATFVAVAT